MKTFLTLSLAALLLAGCSGQEDTNSDYSDLTDTEDSEVEDTENTDEEEVVEDDGSTSVGPSTIPSDLIPSRPQ